MTEEALPDVERSAGSAVGAWALAVMALIGLGISAYLTAVHYAGGSPICAGGGPINCGAVTSSKYSVIPGTGVPVTVPGMLWFIASGALAWIGLSRARRGLAEPSWLRPVQAGWGVVGLLSVLYFVYAELVLLHEICEWCTGVHILVFLSLLVAVIRLRPSAAPG
ncbi:MAG TPA: vitamin K epoxide reductase family protein [Candidatus Binatia bacterium]|nr:vitamin K epoxide reductase family protein [Candidatus Binatia bacterium]